jgi:uncharacterized protein (DUF433 family)
MDWSGCQLVEVIPGKVSGVPLVVGTRIPADVIFDFLDSSSPLEEIEESYPSLSKETIAALISYAESQQLGPSSDGSSLRGSTVG